MTSTKAQKNLAIYGYAQAAKAVIDTALTGCSEDERRRIRQALAAHLRASPSDAMRVTSLAETATLMLPEGAEDALRAECIKTLAKVL